MMQAVSVALNSHDFLTVVLRGEIDFTQASQIATSIRAAISDRRPHAVCIDLAQVTFLDSSGIGALVQAMKASNQVNATFTVQNPTPPVFEQLDLAGLLEAFGMRRLTTDGRRP